MSSARWASEEDRCAHAERIRRIDTAFRQGSMEALRASVDDPDTLPNGPMPIEIGSCLEYAVYHSPIAFIRELLEIGADPSPADHAGFPPLIAALTCTRSELGSRARPDVTDILRLLLRFGADPDQRGFNDFTPLHQAVMERSAEAIEVLLAGGADPRLRTRIDDLETPRELAEAQGLSEIAEMLAAAESKASSES